MLLSKKDIIRVSALTIFILLSSFVVAFQDEISYAGIGIRNSSNNQYYNGTFTITTYLFFTSNCSGTPELTSNTSNVEVDNGNYGVSFNYSSSNTTFYIVSSIDGENQTCFQYTASAQALLAMNATFLQGYTPSSLPMSGEVTGTLGSSSVNSLVLNTITYSGLLGFNNLTKCSSGDILEMSGGNWICGSDSTGSNNYASGVSVTGTNTKNITITRTGLSPISALFTDLQGGDTDTLWVINETDFINDTAVLSLNYTTLNTIYYGILNPEGFFDTEFNLTTLLDNNYYGIDNPDNFYSDVSNFTDDLENKTLVSCNNITGATSNLCTLTDTTYSDLSEFNNDVGFFDDITNFTGAKTNDKICTYDSTSGEINCTYTDIQGGTDTLWVVNETDFVNDTDVLGLNYTTLNGLYIELTDNFVGDVTGTYNVTVVGDDTHLHDWINITNKPANLDLDGTDDFTDISNFTGTLTSGKICTYDGSEIDCDYTDIDTFNSTEQVITAVNNTALNLTNAKSYPCSQIIFDSGVGSPSICDGDDDAGAGTYDWNATTDDGGDVTILNSEELVVAGGDNINTTSTGNTITINSEMIDTDTNDGNVSSICDGSTTYLDGDGNCDTLDEVGDFLNDVGFYSTEANLTNLLDNNYYGIDNPDNFYNDVSNFTDDLENKTLVSCYNITGGSDGDYCADADTTYTDLSEFNNDVGFFDNITNFTGALTNAKICTYDSTSGEINCTYTDIDTFNSTEQVITAVNNTALNGTNFKTIPCSEIIFDNGKGSAGICDGDDSAGAGSYDLNITSDSGSGVITDSEIFTITGGNNVNTTVSGNAVTINSEVVDTNTNDGNASSICNGGTTYLDGDGNCDDLSLVYYGILNPEGFFDTEFNLTTLLDNNYYGILNPDNFYSDLSNFTGTLTNTYHCRYDSGGTEIDCDVDVSAWDTDNTDDVTKGSENLTLVSCYNITGGSDGDYCADADTTYSDLSEFNNDVGYYYSEINLTSLLDNNYYSIFNPEGFFDTEFNLTNLLDNNYYGIDNPDNFYSDVSNFTDDLENKTLVSCNNITGGSDGDYCVDADTTYTDQQMQDAVNVSEQYDFYSSDLICSDCIDGTEIAELGDADISNDLTINSTKDLKTTLNLNLTDTSCIYFNSTNTCPSLCVNATGCLITSACSGTMSIVCP
jgi:hypothetical protein